MLAAKGSGKAPVGLRLCTAYFGLAMGLALLFAFLCPPSMFEYDLSMIRVLTLMAGGAATLWLLYRRATSARVVGSATALLCAGLSIVDHAALGAYATLSGYIGQFATSSIMFVEYIGAVAVAVYLLASPQAKLALHEPVALVPRAEAGHSWDEPLKERIKTRVFWRDLLIYFIVFSLLGHWLEILFCRLIEAGVFMGEMDYTNAMLWDQWLFPFTAEGAAAIAIVLLLHPAARWLTDKTGGRIWMAVILSFLLNALVCTSIDFTTGMIANQNYELWDYRALPFNFMGQVCLQNSMVYSIAATLIVWVFYPLMDTGLRRAPNGVVNAVSFGLLGMYLFLALLHFVDLSALSAFLAQS